MTQLTKPDTEDALVRYHRQYVAASMENLKRQMKLLKMHDKKDITKEAYVKKLITMMENTESNVEKLKRQAIKHRGNSKEFNISRSYDNKLKGTQRSQETLKVNNFM